MGGSVVASADVFVLQDSRKEGRHWYQSQDDIDNPDDVWTIEFYTTQDPDLSCWVLRSDDTDDGIMYRARDNGKVVPPLKGWQPVPGVSLLLVLKPIDGGG